MTAAETGEARGQCPRNTRRPDCGRKRHAERSSGSPGCYIGRRFKAGGPKLFFAGKGGSAADGQAHRGGYVLNRFSHDRRALAAIALTTR